MRTIRFLSRVVTVGLGLALVASTAAASPPVGSPADAALGQPTSVGLPTVIGNTITFTGHGWGHGRGMGQYGALGYAVDHGWSWTQILDHFYSNTTMGSIGNPEISVELLARRGADLVVTAAGLTINGTPVGGGVIGLVARVQTNGTVRISSAGACANEGGVIGIYPAGVRISTTSQASVNDLVRVCDASGSRAYRGSVSVQKHASSGVQTAFNWLPMEQYLRGVVPRESPASWGSLGAGKGMEALKAQSVAARSYAWSSTYSSGSKTCDTTACQVYGGAVLFNAQYPSGFPLESSNTDAAIAATSGQVRMLAGAVARTEFSSSTGGYTTGGTFPAVVDEGDDISINPNHNWTTTLTTATIASRLNIPGPVRDVRVTARNGHGDWGGRVTQVVVVDANGASRTYTGGAFRTAMGTSTFKSDWFTLSWVSTVEAEKVVNALYQDVLGRGVDPSGLATWTEYIQRTRDTAGLVRLIATSRERMNNLVAAQYRLALNRGPEPAGLDHWVRYLEGGWGVYALQVAIYGSPESLQVLGGGDVNSWVGGLYTTLLGRASAPSEREFWTNIAARQGREAVVAAIARSDEATMRRLTVYYRTFLLRDVDPSGRATFLPMMTGRGDFDVPIHLGSSPEYWARAQTRTY
jgi:SpoIID/LytB domain protein